MKLSRFLRFRLAWVLILMIPLGIGFGWLRHYLNNRPIHWVDYSREELDANLAEGRMVLVNFRANWTISTVMHEQLALETPSVRRAIHGSSMIALRADWSDGSPEITAALDSLEHDAIPVVAIYPGSPPHEPIVLTDGISEEAVLAALKRADR